MSETQGKPVLNLNFHNHPEMERKLGVDKDHVIVDRDAWENVIKSINLLKEDESEDLECLKEIQKRLEGVIAKL
jgi:hypothetical protein